MSYSYTYETDSPFNPTPSDNYDHHPYTQDGYTDPQSTAAQYGECDYPPASATQPQYDPDLFVSPNSTAAQMGLTSEEVRELLEHQENWLREEYQQEQAVDTPTRDTEHQRQQYVQPLTRNHQLPTTETYEPP